MKHKGLRQFVTASLLLACIMCVSQVALAVEDNEAQKQRSSHHNVMMVIDGSGSLVSKNNPTDPDGLRYDAVDLFFALLTDSGNKVGAVVFDDNSNQYLLDTGLVSVSGKTEKLTLSKKIRDSGTRNDTDIGSALLTAVERLEAESDSTIPSEIILFSDGRTDLRKKDDRTQIDQKAYSVSIANKDKAITRAQELGIPIYSVCLSASSVADPAELEEISKRTSGEFVKVDRPEDLALAFQQFYKLIFETPQSQETTYSFSDSGNVNIPIDVPSVGAEEVNVILKMDVPYKASLSSPSGAKEQKFLEDATMSGGPYDVIKLVQPEAGRWTLRLNGASGDDVLVNVLYNFDSEVVLQVKGDKTELAANDSVQVTAGLLRDGKAVNDPSVTKEYTAVLFKENLSSGKKERIPMQANEKGQFTAEVFSEEVASYDLTAVLTYKNLKVTSNQLVLNYGNTAPEIQGEELITEKVIVTPLTGRSRAYDLNAYFNDKQGDAIHYSIVSSQLVDGTTSLSEGDGVLTVDTAHSRSGDLVVRATDAQGAFSDMTIHFKVTNLTLAIVLAIVLPILTLAAVMLLGWYRHNHKLFTGLLRVRNLQTGYSHEFGSFRGKKFMSQFPIGDTGFPAASKKCCFFAKGKSRLEFRSPNPFYVNGLEKKAVDVYDGMAIHSDKDEINGIEIQIDIF